MGKRILVISAVLALAIGLSWYALSAGRPGSLQAVSTAPDGTPLAVSNLKSAPEQFRGEISVVGIVGEAKAGQGPIFGLADIGEMTDCVPSDAASCADCATFLLPVSWSGEMPAVGATVVVKGRVERRESGLVLAASEVATR